jgi:hypothetical protein
MTHFYFWELFSSFGVFPNDAIIVKSGEDVGMCVNDWWKAVERGKTECSEIPGIPRKASMRKNKGLQGERPEI